MAKITRIGPPLPVLAVTITDELFGDKSLKAIGRDQIDAAIDARKLGLDQFAREDLIALVCRKIVNRAMRTNSKAK